MLHKSSENVDVTYKVDVKFNVIGLRMKSGRIASRVSLRNYVTDSIRISLSHDVLISISTTRTGRRKKNFFFSEEGTNSYIYRCTRATESPTRVTLHPRDEKSSGPDFRRKMRGRRSNLREIAVDYLV